MVTTRFLFCCFFKDKFILVTFGNTKINTLFWFGTENNEIMNESLGFRTQRTLNKIVLYDLWNLHRLLGLVIIKTNILRVLEDYLASQKMHLYVL